MNDIEGVTGNNSEWGKHPQQINTETIQRLPTLDTENNSIRYSRSFK